MSTNEPVRVRISDYINDLSKYGSSHGKAPSPYTLTTYNQTKDMLGFDEIDTSQAGLDSMWKSINDRYDNHTLKYGFVKNGIPLIKATLNWFEVQHNSELNHQYKILKKKLNRDKPEPKKAYTDDDVKETLKSLWQWGDRNTFCACLMMASTACRILSTKDVKFSDFQPISEVPDVLVIELVGKGRTYTTAIAKTAFDLLKSRSVGGDYVVRFNKYTQTRYDTYFRLHLRNKVHKDNNLHLLAGKSALHAYRKWAIGKLAMDGMHTEDIAKLAGHFNQSYNKMTQKHYVDSNTFSEQWKIHIAKLYSGTKLANFPWSDM